MASREPEAASPVASAAPAPWSRVLGLANMLLPGLYAWVTTVAFPTTYREAPSSAQVSAMLALAALVAGPIVAMDRPRWGRAIGVLVFIGFSVLTWVLLGPLLSIDGLDPFRAAAGAVGWMLFAFGWGAVRRTGYVPEEDPHALTGPPLVARARPVRGAGLVFGLALAGALASLMTAWWITRPEHAMLGHAAALVCAIALLDAGARIAVGRGRWKPIVPPRRRLERATRSLGLLTLALALGFVWALLR